MPTNVLLKILTILDNFDNDNENLRDMWPETLITNLKNENLNS